MNRQINAFYALPPLSDDFLKGGDTFILLQTTRGDADNLKSRLYFGVSGEHILYETSGIREYLQELDRFDPHLHRAGYLSFESGYLLQGLETNREPDGPELPGYFASFLNRISFDHSTGNFECEGDRADADFCFNRKEVSFDFEPKIFHAEFTPGEDLYNQKIRQILEYIRNGETYQVNFAGKFYFHNQNPVDGLFRALSQSQPVPYTSWIHTPDMDILSFSPELFFILDEHRNIITRPMKGTARRGRSSAEDQEIIQSLMQSEKINAENKMIVDLMRNDIGKFATIGSVEVFDIMRPEIYSTLIQLSSGVRGEVPQEVTVGTILSHLFPSGSVTGAPKRKTMEIIDRLEDESRGVFTGCIGDIEAGGAIANFSIPIRTVVLQESTGHMGAGSGIVADSDPTEEFHEVELKGRFLTSPVPDFSIIETFRLEGDDFKNLDDHLERLESSALYFQYPYNDTRIRSLLNRFANNLGDSGPHRVRLLLSRNGDVRIESETLPVQSNEPILLGISTRKTDEKSPFYYHKTTNRAIYNQEREWMKNQTRMDEMIFFNSRGELTEGTVTNVFLKIQGVWYTPPIECGLLAGIGRKKHLEENPEIQVRVLKSEDLHRAEEILLVSSLRGARKAMLMF